MCSIGRTNRMTECSNPFFFMLELKTASITLRTSTGTIDSYFLCLLLWCFTAVTILSVFSCLLQAIVTYKNILLADSGVIQPTPN